MKRRYPCIRDGRIAATILEMIRTGNCSGDDLRLAGPRCAQPRADDVAPAALRLACID
jgi:hypothetical protein